MPYPLGYDRVVNFVKIDAVEPVVEQPVAAVRTARWLTAVRVLVTATVAVGVVIALVSNLGLTTAEITWAAVVELVAGAPRWALPVGAAGAVLVGIIVATYIAAAPGARVTFCDLRWPIIGVIGLSLAIDTPGGEPLVQEMFGVSASTTLVLQPVLGLTTLVLLGWALKKRLALVRAAREAEQDSGAPEACETCIPIFPGGK